jgi:hypothetical protein
LLSSHPNGQEKNSPRILQAYEKYPFAQTDLHFIELQERLERYVAAGQPIVKNKDFQDRSPEKWLFEPKAIYRFLNGATLYQPPLALHSAVEEPLKAYLETKNVQIPHAKEGLDEKRTDVLDKWIDESIRKYSDQQAKERWNDLEKEADSLDWVCKHDGKTLEYHPFDSEDKVNTIIFNTFQNRVSLRKNHA